MKDYRHFAQRVSIFLALLVCTPIAHAVTWYVDPSGFDTDPGTSWASSKKTIQAAIDVASVGDTVLVSNGVYAVGSRVAPGLSLTNRVVIDKALTVVSVNGPEVTIIQGAKDPVTTNGAAAVRCVWMASGSSLSGFTLTNGATLANLLGGLAEDSRGGGVLAADASSVISHCVLTGNSAGNNGGGAYQGTLNNCLLTGNSAGNRGGGAIGGTINYTCTTPMPSGTGNITNDPQFVSLAATNLQLSAGSPARDMGNNADAPSGPDLAGNPRIVHTFVDMGAYEFQGSPPGDFDGDGMSTTDERIAGSDPLNADDVWGVDAVIGPASLGFNTLSNRLYAVERNDNLVAVPQVWIEFTNNIPGTGGPLVITDSLPGTNRNYRVRVEMTPD